MKSWLRLFSRSLLPKPRSFLPNTETPPYSPYYRHYFTSTPRHHQHPQQLPVPPPLDLLQQLHNIVYSEVGSLDDMESHLDQLGAIVTPALVSEVIDSGNSAASRSIMYTRRLLRFFSWSRRNGAEQLGDEVFNDAIRALAEGKDFTALGIMFSDLRREQREMETETFTIVSEALVKSGREVDAVRLFKDLEKHHQHRQQEGTCSPSSARVTSIIHALCLKGHSRKAEGVIWHHKDKLSSAMEPDIYRQLLHGWCTRRNAGEARRVLGEMKAAGICPGLGSYNAFLRCICDRNLRFNPSALVPEANDVMAEMRSSRVQPDAVSFNILLSCLGRTRRVKEACTILDSMVQGQAGCPPDWFSYYLVIRVLYLTERFIRGNRIALQMIESGVVPETRFYHDLVGILCGVERMDHALQMFELMKKRCTENTGPTYDLLIAKLCRNGEFDMGRRLWDEAVEGGIILRCSVDLMDPSKVEVFKLRKKADKPNLKDLKAMGQKEKKGIAGKKSEDKRHRKAYAT